MPETEHDQSNKLPQYEEDPTQSPTGDSVKHSNLSVKSPRNILRKNDDWPYKNIRFNEQVAVYEVPGFDESRSMAYSDYETRENSTCCIIQ